MKCENCNEEETDTETINKSIKRYKMLLCKSCFKKYNTADIQEGKEREVGDGLSLKKKEENKK